MLNIVYNKLTWVTVVTQNVVFINEINWILLDIKYAAKYQREWASQMDFICAGD